MRNKKQRNAALRPDRYTPVPDSILERAAQSISAHTSLDARQQVQCVYTLYLVITFYL